MTLRHSWHLVCLDWYFREVTGQCQSALKEQSRRFTIYRPEGSYSVSECDVILNNVLAGI